MIQLDLLKKIILDKKILDETSLSNTLKESKTEKTSLEQYLVNKRLVTEDILYQTAAEKLNLPFINLEKIKIDDKVLSLIPESIATKHSLIGFEQDAKT